MISRTFLLLLFALPFAAIAQSETDDIIEIRKGYVETERKLGTCSVFEENDWQDFNLDDGLEISLKGYYDDANSNYIKVVEEIKGDWTNIRNEYFLRDGELFFIFKSGFKPIAEDLVDDEAAKEDHSLADPESLKHFEERIYIAFGEVIKYLVKDKEQPTGDPAFNFKNTGSKVGDSNELDLLGLMERVERLVQALN